ncbi:hypothetical protein [Methanobrevibacter sp.]|uniref:hypothetical protein n=1 Tax=Methanobrevibacter sp. TaxID=66852 RepID=UPI00386EB755
MVLELILIPIFQILAAMGIFAVFVYVGRYIVNKGKLFFCSKDSRILDPREYFPSEELLSLKQVFYLMMILLIVMICLYLTFDWNESLIFIYILDIVVSTYLALDMGKDTLKEKLLLFFLVPFGSLIGIVFGDGIIVLLDIFHIIGYLYFIKVYYRKFVKYTENNGLGITIVLLFVIILVSFLFTIVIEGVSPLDSMTMVSNAFTSNSFDASGNTIIGKINSLVLAWSGFILSGVGTATLAVSIVNRYVTSQFDEMKDLVKKKKEDK